MFQLFKKKDLIEDKLYAPVIGQAILLENVPDNMFAQKILGDGVGFAFEGDTIYSPCDSEVVMIADTKHAFGIKMGCGAELLIHIGLDTVELNGEGFEVLVKQGKKIRAHTPLVKLNRPLMKERNINLITPMILTNTADYEIIKEAPGDVTLESLVMTVRKK